MMTDAQMRDALQECDKALIHTPQSLQSFGVVLGIDLERDKIAFCSQNAQKHIDIDTDKLLGSNATELFGTASKDVVNKLSQMKNNSYICEFIEICGKRTFARVVRWNEFAIIEIQDEEQSFVSDEHLRFLDKTNSVLLYANSTEELFSLYLDALREYIGFDRVMLYKFDAKFDGEVIAESRQDYLGSFLGHRFPSSDIPQSARDMYAKNPVRFIENAGSDDVKLLFLSPDYEKLVVDLSYINSRAVAPVHIEYLKNMSVKASMSISVLDESGRLWGLIACHNNTPSYISLQKRLHCEQSSKVLSLSVTGRENAERNYKLAVRHAALSDLVSIGANSFENLFKYDESDLQKSLVGLIEASGIAICSAKRVIRAGITPEVNTIHEIINLLSFDLSSPVATTNSLASIDKKYERLRKKASGVLLLKISDQQHIVWFRSEVQKEIAWAGQPIKKFYDDNGTYRVSPRKSFETWHEQRFLTSDEWSDEDIYFATNFCKTLLKSKLDGYENIHDVQTIAVSDKMFQLFDIMPQSVIMTDLDGIINYTNRAFEKMSGFASKDAIGKYASILSSGKHERSFYADMWATILGMKVWSDRIINARSNGELYKVDATIAPIVSSKGDIIGFAGIEHEITELANMLEYEIKEKNAILGSLSESGESSSIIGGIEMSNVKYQAKKELLSQIAHHWRNPLNVISIYVQDLVFAYKLNELNDDAISEFSAKCMDAINNMSKMIASFSNYFRPEGEEEEFNPADIVLETLKAMSSYIGEKKINIIFDRGGSEYLVYGLRSALSAVMLELLNNIGDIIEARNLKGADVWMQIYGDEDDVILEISDNCGGIEDSTKAFEPYYTTKGASSGIGLGLFEVKVLVEKHLHGSVEVSNGTLGVKFMIRLSAKGGTNEVQL